PSPHQPWQCSAARRCSAACHRAAGVMRTEEETPGLPPARRRNSRRSSCRPSSCPSGKQDGRQPSSSRERPLVVRSPRLEELDELLARLLILPLAVARNDFKEVVDSSLTIAAGILDQRQVETGIVILRIGGKARGERHRVSQCTRLAGK